MKEYQEEEMKHKNIFILFSVVIFFIFGWMYPLAQAEQSLHPGESQSSEERLLLPLEKDSAEKNQSNRSIIDEHPYHSIETLDIDPSTGSVNISIPIQVPRGRSGIEPRVLLFYNSTASGGMLGYGWSFEPGRIIRSTKRGVPTYSCADTFMLVQSGSQQILIDTSSDATEFQLEAEGAFLKIQWIDHSYWIVTDRAGVKYFFGQNDEARIYDPDDSSRVFEWKLDYIEDVHGNNMTISYFRNQGQLYPKFIKYTGNSKTGANSFAKVEFNWLFCSHSFSSSIRGFLVNTQMRLSRIKIYAGNSFQRQYQFAYTQSSSTGNFLLTSITQKGLWNNESLPPTLFEYSDYDIFYKPSFSLSHHPPISFGHNSLVHLMDMNKNGLPDMVRTHTGEWPQNGKPWQIYFNDGYGDFGPPQNVTNSPIRGTDNVNVQFYDFNGDGIMDVIFGQAPPYQIWLSDGSGDFLGPYTMSQQPTQNISITHDKLIQFLDMNGNGRMDMIETRSGSNQPWRIYFNLGEFENGIAHFSSGQIIQQSPVRGCNNPNIRFFDFNGDGLLDVIYGENNPYLIWINNGVDGFQEPVAVNQHPGISISQDNLIHFIDMNSDGLVDMVQTQKGSGKRWYIYYNNGKGGFLPKVSAVHFPDFGMDNSYMRMLDLNGNGLLDVLYGPPQGHWHAWINNGRNGYQPKVPIVNRPQPSINHVNMTVIDLNGDNLPDFFLGDSAQSYRVWPQQSHEFSAKPDLLVKVNNSIGGEKQIFYQHVFVEGLLGPRFHRAFGSFLLSVAETVAKKTSLGHIYEVRYAYHRGLWNHLHREFRGFGLSTIFEADGHYIKRTIHQDDIFKGRLIQQESYDNQGNLYFREEYTWAKEDLASGARFLYLSQRDRYFYDSSEFGHRTQEKFFYEEIPQLGNLTKHIMMGEVDFLTGEDIPGDNRVTETEYLNNIYEGHWLIGLAKKTTVTDSSGHVARRTWLYYDQDEGHVALPTKGLLTKKENWAGDGLGDENPVMRYFYDEYANLKKIQDADGYETLITYDSDCFLFPVEIENALGHKVIKEYYGIHGVPYIAGSYQQKIYGGSWGQLKGVQDPNGQQGKRMYDGFGRLALIFSPLDSPNFPLTVTSYQMGPYGVKIGHQQRERHGLEGTLDSVDFYDGFGRLIQRKAESAQPYVFIVSGHTEYNARGLPIKKYLPFFSETPIDEIDPVDPNRPHITIDYDAMGRVVETVNPDGTYASIVYDGWKTIMIDENGHQKISYADAYGRIIKIEEYLGSDGRSPFYPQEPFTLYSATLYSYDSEGKMIRVQDAHGNETMIHFDNLGRKVAMQDPDMGYWQYQYDARGNLVWQKDAMQQEMFLIYDPLGRLQDKTDSENHHIQYYYDYAQADGQRDSFLNKAMEDYAIGRLKSVQYPYQQETFFSYDILGREDKTQKKIDSILYEVARTYDALDRITTLTYPDQGKVIYTYNNAGQVNGIGMKNNSQLGLRAQKGSKAIESQAKSVSHGPVFDQGGFLQEENFSYSDFLISEMDSNQRSISININVNPIQPLKGFRQLYHIDLDWVSPYQETVIFVILVEKDTGSYLSGGWDWGASTPTTWRGEHFPVSSGPGSVMLVKDLEIFKSLLGQDINNYWWIAEVRQVRQGFIYDPWNQETFFIRKQTKIDTVAAQEPPFEFSFSPSNPHPGVAAIYDFDVFWDNLPMVPGEDYRLYYALEAPISSGCHILATHEPHSIQGWFQNIDIPDYISYGEYTETRDLVTYSHYKHDPIDRYRWTAQLRRVHPGRPYNPHNPWSYIVAMERNSKVDPGSGLRLRLTTNHYHPIIDHQKHYEIQFAWLDPIPTFNNDLYDYKYYFTLFDADSMNLAALDEQGQWWETEGFILDSGPNSVVTHQNLTVMNNGYFSLPNTNTFMWLGQIRRYPKGDYSEYIVIAECKQKVPGKDFLGEILIKDVFYNAAGQMTRIEYGNGSSSDYFYDSYTLRLNQLITYDPQGNMIQNMTYFYDSVGNMIAIQDDLYTASQVFSYDALNRLVQAEGSYGVKFYFYDEIGNIIEKDEILYTYGENGAGPHAVTSLSNGTTFSYDANGNMIQMNDHQGVVWEYAHDRENRLKSVKRNSVLKAEYAYDGDGGRTKKTVYKEKMTSIHSARSSEVFDVGRFSHRNFAALFPPGISSKTVTRYIGSLYEEAHGQPTRYIFLGNQRIAHITNEQVMLYFNDHLGSLHILTDNVGEIKELCEYEPFGEFSRHEQYGSSPQVSWFYFSGKLFDEESGLFYYGARYYNSLIGRFITADPMMPNPLNSQALNRYSYVYNSPVCFIDPSGNFPWFIIAAIVGAIIGGISSYQNTGSVQWQGVLFGGVMGAMSGATIAAAGHGMTFLKASAWMSLGSQVASVASRDPTLSRSLGYAAMGLSALSFALDVIKGIKNWIHEDSPELGFYEVFSGKDGSVSYSLIDPSEISTGGTIFTNGIATSLEQAAFDGATRYNAQYLYYNPTAGGVADFTESMLQKIFRTSSLDRQFAHGLAQVQGPINLVAHSQGTITVSNALLNLGISGRQLAQGSSVIYMAAAISQPMAVLSSWMGSASIPRGSGVVANIFDPINIVAPNFNPVKFTGGMIGLATTLGFHQHSMYGY